MRYSWVMPKNPDLVPTVIVDVNGRTTVVHRLRQLFAASGASGGARIPAPVVASTTPPRKVVLKSLLNSLSESVQLTRRSDIKMLKEGLDYCFSDDSLRWLSEAVARKDSFGSAAAKQIVQYSSTWRQNLLKLEPRLRSEAMFQDALDIDDYGTVHGLVYGLGFEFTKVNDFRELDEHSLSQCVALMKTTHALSERYPVIDENHMDHPVYQVQTYLGFDGWILKDPLHSLVMERPEDAEAIAEYAVQRHTTDANLIRALLSGIPSPLAEGGL